MRNCSYDSAELSRNVRPPESLPQSSRRPVTPLGWSMSTDPALDRASFERFLASASAVQNSGLDKRSLSALIELQRSITAGDTSLAQAMHMVAERARAVANASGVSVAQLIGNQLVYRAGSGSAEAFIGRHVTAVLSASASDDARAEILRVENAQSDTRIEAEVCRLFGANALLIVPVYRDHAVAGVLEVFFGEPHTFEDREVLLYRAMARLVEEAMSADARFEQKELEQKKAAAAQLKAAPPVFEPAGSTVPALRGNDELAVPPEMLLALSKLRWNVAAAALAAVLVIAGWFAYRHRSASHMNASSQKSNAAQEAAAAKPSPVSDGAESLATSTAVTTDAKPPGSGFRRVRVGQNEVDYIAEDVTIRHFTNSARPQIAVGERRVNFGKDVTVRYFSSQPPVSPLAQPVPAIERSVER